MRPDLKLTAPACIGGALALLILPLRWILALVIAALIHELCHMMTLKLYHVSVQSIIIDLGGAVIETGEIAPLQEILCALSGPFGSFLLLLLAQWMPLAALFGTVQGLYNLLPFYPMDGGRALRAVLEWMYPASWEKKYISIEKCLMVMFAGGSVVFLSVMKAWKLMPLLLIIPLRNLIRRKIPCNDGR